MCNKVHWAIPDKFCPPLIEDVSTTYAKSMEFHLIFCKLFLEIQPEKTKKCGFWPPVWIFCWNLCENKDFFQKTWKSRTILYKKKSGNPAPSMGGGGIFFWNSPLKISKQKQSGNFTDEIRFVSSWSARTRYTVDTSDLSQLV